MDSNNSKKQILKSTGIIGGAQIIIILISIIRTKIVAVLLGPLGVGISGLFQSSIDLIRSGTGLGLHFSSVRDIATSSLDEARLSKVVEVMRRWLWFTGLFGTFVVIIFSKQLSIYAFGNSSYRLEFIILSVTILMASLASGHFAVLSGLRKISALAQANILGTVVGFITTIPLYFIWGIEGIVPAIFIMGAVGLIIPWVYVRNITFSRLELSIRETFKEGTGMIKLGMFTVIAGFSEIGTMYLVRIYVGWELGIDSVGYFIAAWSISTMYMSLVINAMSADFFPRLSTLQNDQRAMNKVVNEQTEVALLIASPIIIGMISFITFFIRIFYSDKFLITAEILNWQLVGDFFKILAWPLSFSLMATKSNGKFYLFMALLFNFLYMVGIYAGWELAGLKTTGISFALSYIIVFFVLHFIAKKVLNFNWSQKAIIYIFIYGFLVLLAFINSHYITHSIKIFFGIVITLVSALYSLYHLNKIFNFKNLLVHFKILKT